MDDMEIPYTVDSTLVRGLDYYNHTAFEIMSSAEGFGAITTLCGGGRYNGLVEDFGGPETPGIGFALSVERLIAALDAEGITLPIEKQSDLYVVALGDAAKDYSVKLVNEVRQHGFSADKDYGNRKIKAQFKAADRVNARFVAVLGDDELSNNKITLKDMATGDQQELDLHNFIEEFKRIQQ